MQLHGQGPKHKHSASAHIDALTLHAVEIALTRAHQSLCAGRLIAPGEALALACGAAREKDTLYSIARAVAWETHTDVDEIEAHLKAHYPDLAK